MMSTATATNPARSKFPFTATQWQELEHQALIYKYMSAGIPIPPDLLFTVKRSLDNSLSSKLFPYQTSPLGWNPYQMGYGKKIDPEPGRCRRTDGKKWRCSKEAYPDSKYCERHMHRGKNRSRKPVENSPSTNTPTATALHSLSTVSALTNNNNNNNPSANNNNSHSVTTATLSSATSNNNPSSLTNQSLLSNPNKNLYSLPISDPSPYSSLYTQKDFSRDRYYNGLREEVGEHAFFTESSGSNIRGFEENWPLGGTNNNSNNNNSTTLDHSKHSSAYPNYLHQFNNSNNNASTKQQQQQDKQCYIWGRDFNNCDLSMKVEDENESTRKTTHHFFDEWPLRTGGAGGGGDRNNSWHDSSSTTQLSISIPSSTSHHDFFNSRTHHHDG